MSVTSGDRMIEIVHSPVKTVLDPFRDERKGIVREVGNQAIWSLSSCKPGILFCMFELLISFIFE